MTDAGLTSDVPVHSWTIGEIVVTAITEMAGIGFGPVLLPQATPDAVREVDWLDPGWHERGQLMLGVHMFVVDTAGERLVVDTCVGNDKKRAVPIWNGLKTDFLSRLAAVGVPPSTVDAVVTTHLHADHIGWNTTWTGDRWEPTFPNAHYHVARDEFDYWAAHEDPERVRMLADSVLPVRDAGLLRLADTSDVEETVVAPGVGLRPTRGHTPGHVSVVLSSRGETAMITGDVIHHPVQLAHPHWSSAFDTDPVQTARVRRSLLDEAVDTRTMLLGSAFTHPHAVRVTRHGAGYRAI